MKKLIFKIILIVFLIYVMQANCIISAVEEGNMMKNVPFKYEEITEVENLFLGSQAYFHKIKNNGKYKIYDIEKKIISEKQFDDVLGYYPIDLFIVKVNNKYGVYINRGDSDKNTLYLFDNIKQPPKSGKYFGFKRNGKWAVVMLDYIRWNGDNKLKFIYDDVRLTTGDNVYGGCQNGKCRAVSRYDEMHSEFMYDDIRELEINVITETSFGYRPTRITEWHYDSFKPLYVIIEQDGKLGLYSFKEGKEISSIKYNKIYAEYSRSENILTGSKPEKIKIIGIDKNNKKEIILDLSFTPRKVQQSYTW